MIFFIKKVTVNFIQTILVNVLNLKIQSFKENNFVKM